MSQRDVCYSCGACGYSLNLSSSQRILTSIDSKYHKSIKKGTISFLTIDESRFKQLDEFKCGPYIQNKNSWGIHRLRTKLLCGNCGGVIGHGHETKGVSSGLDGSDSSSGSGTQVHGRFCVKIKALQPSHEPDPLSSSSL
eukprot:c23527_g1_i1 orf=766-1185(-)